MVKKCSKTIPLSKTELHNMRAKTRRGKGSRERDGEGDEQSVSIENGKQSYLVNDYNYLIGVCLDGQR